jgi:predicted esterase
MDKLNRVLRDKISLIIVGSSFGGLMAAVFACNNQRRIKRLILLAPALTFEEFKPYLAQKIHTPVIVFHGKNDDVILLAAVYEIACSVFENLTFNAIDDDHVLSKTFESLDWDNLLNGVKTR